MREAEFRAMGSDIHVIVVGGAATLIDVARSRIEELERRWSRFLPDSEISLLNARGAERTEVSADTCLLVQHAIEAWRLTGGGFDPTMLDALRHAGYDRTFEQIGTVASLPAPRPLAIDRPACTDIEVELETGAERGHVMFPSEVGFDPGGIGKGLAADLVSAELLDAGADGVCVNMGGDVRVRGESPTGAGWTVAIEHPRCAEPLALVGLWDGAVATSSVLKRVWDVGGRRRHHLLDPATGEPSESDLALASVIAVEAWIAEVLAKAVLLRGSERAFDLLDDTTAAIVVDHDGRVTASGGFGAYVGGVPIPAAIVVDPGDAITT